jgi:hypothetical protein
MKPTALTKPPFRVHQIWISYGVNSQREALEFNSAASTIQPPQKYDACRASWRALAESSSGAIVYTLWTTDLAARFLQERCGPKWIELYWRLPFPVMRTDLLRLLLLWQYGGIYADIDVEIRENRRRHVSALLCALGERDFLLAPVRCLGNGLTSVWFPNNDLLACARPRHPFVAELLNLLQRRVASRRWLEWASTWSRLFEFFYIVHTTGPLLIYDAYRECEKARTSLGAHVPTRFLIFPKVREANTFAVSSGDKAGDGDCDGDVNLHDPAQDMFLDRSSGSWFSARLVIRELVPMLVLILLVTILSVKAIRRFALRASHCANE